MKLGGVVIAGLSSIALFAIACGVEDDAMTPAAPSSAAGSGGSVSGGGGSGSGGASGAGESGSGGSSGAGDSGQPSSGGGPPLTDDAEISDTSFPQSIACNQSGQASVTVKNTGTSSWTPGGGYKLGAVDDSDPFHVGGRILLPSGSSILPGQSWTFGIPLVAAGQAGSHVSDWRMVREGVTWFGQSTNPTVAVTCQTVTPDVYSVIQQVAAQRPDLLTTNTWESCGTFVQYVLQALNSPDWGHVGKTAGEGQYSPPGFSMVVDGYQLTGFSHDVIWHKPSNKQVDIVGNAAARSDPDPAIWGNAVVHWDEIPSQHYRPNNPWLAPVAP